jgi:Plavaka transposase
MTGGRMAHPLLLSLANLDISFRMKALNHAYLLLSLLPVPKFIHTDSKICGILENRLLHECLDFILEPLKIAARIGVMMSDALGSLRYVFTPLASYVVDTPESAMLAGVGGKTSSVTMASHKTFGDAFQHEPRTASCGVNHTCSAAST